MNPTAEPSGPKSIKPRKQKTKADDNLTNMIEPFY